MTAVAPIDRFWRHVDMTDGCWNWTSTVAGSKGKYPTFRHTTRMSDPRAYAHRWIYREMVGQIPEGWEVDHTCRNTICVRPDHLEAVPALENKRRSRLDVCRSGRHDLSQERNARFDQRGRRRGCLPCYQEKAKLRRRTIRGGQ